MMSKPWKQIKIFTGDGDQSVIIELTPNRDGVCIHSKEEMDKQEFCLYASYDEALAINQNKDEFI
jgi:hypothetical protein